MGKGRGKGREEGGALKCGGCVAGFVLLLVIILVSSSFSKLEYYEYGFAKRLTTSTVDRSKVYGAGNHLLGPDYSFVTFPANVISVEQDDLSAWTRADAGTASSTGSAGTSVIIDVSYQYRLIKTQLSDLFKKRNVNFKPFVENLAVQAIKNNATQFSADDFLKNRENIEKGFLNGLTDALKDANAVAIGVQLRRVEFPQKYVQRMLSAAVQELNNDAENYKKKAALIRETTITMQKYIENDAYKVQENAKAAGKLHKERAENDAIKLRQTARSIGLDKIRKRLKIVSQKHFVSLDYLITLADAKGFKSFVDFSTVLAGG